MIIWTIPYLLSIHSYTQTLSLILTTGSSVLQRYNEQIGTGKILFMLASKQEIGARVVISAKICKTQSGNRTSQVSRKKAIGSRVEKPEGKEKLQGKCRSFKSVNRTKPCIAGDMIDQITSPSFHQRRQIQKPRKAKTRLVSGLRTVHRGRNHC